MEELTIEERLDIAIKDYQKAFEYIILDSVKKYMDKGLSEEDASLIVGEKANNWLKKNGK